MIGYEFGLKSVQAVANLIWLLLLSPVYFFLYRTAI